LLYLGVTIKILQKLVRLKVRKIDYSLCLSVLKESFAVAFIRMFGIINRRIDIIMLSTMSGVSSVGFYGVSSRLINFANVPFTSLGMSLLPRVSSSSKKKQTLKRIYGEAQKFYLFFAFLITIIVFVLSKEIISILFGSDYVAGQSHIALRILILSFFVNKISGPAGVVILSLKERMNKLIPFAFVVALLSVTLNLFLIPRYGIIGASYATLTCAMVMTAIKLFLVKQVVKAGTHGHSDGI
jgi:O-antigen/teichoic acid export membrane protein